MLYIQRRNWCKDITAFFHYVEDVADRKERIIEMLKRRAKQNVVEIIFSERRRLTKEMQVFDAAFTTRLF